MKNKCLICDNENFAYRSYLRYPLQYLPEDTKIRICLTCGFGEVNYSPIDELLNSYYESSAYYKGRKDNYNQLDLLPHHRGFSQYDLLASHFDFKNINKLLDFGAGSAVTTRTIKIRHPYIITTVIEISKPLRILLKSCSEINEVHKEISSVSFSQDLIIASEILEHLTKPISIIKEFNRLLVKNGYLFIEVPNCPYPLYYDCKGSHWPHLSFFTKDSFIQIAKIYDFELIWINGVGMDIREYCSEVEFHAKIMKQTGFIYALNENGLTLRVLLRKGN